MKDKLFPQSSRKLNSSESPSPQSPSSPSKLYTVLRGFNSPVKATQLSGEKRMGETECSYTDRAFREACTSVLDFALKEGYF